MIYETEDFNAIKREPVLWRVPFFILGRLLMFTLGGGVIGEVFFKMIGLDSIGQWLFISGAIITIVIIFYFRSTKNKLGLNELGRFTRNLSRIKQIR
jgi:sulfite exporter TauE/SafE